MKVLISNFSYTSKCDGWFKSTQELKLTGSMKIKAFYSKDASDKNYVIAHERGHVAIHKVMWNSFAQQANEWEGDHDCCCAEAQVVINLRYERAKLHIRIKNLEYDQREYDSLQNDKALAAAKIKYDKVDKKHTKAWDAYAKCRE